MTATVRPQGVDIPVFCGTGLPVGRCRLGGGARAKRLQPLPDAGRHEGQGKCQPVNLSERGRIADCTAECEQCQATVVAVALLILKCHPLLSYRAFCRKDVVHWLLRQPAKRILSSALGTTKRLDGTPICPSCRITSG